MLDLNLGTGAGDGDTYRELIRKLVINQKELALRLTRQERFPFDPALQTPRTADEVFTYPGLDVAAVTRRASLQIANGIHTVTAFRPVLVPLDETTAILMAFTTANGVTFSLVRIESSTGAISIAASTTITTTATSRVSMSAGVMSANKVLAVLTNGENVPKQKSIDTYEITVDRAAPSIVAGAVRTREFDSHSIPYISQPSSNPHILRSGVNAFALLAHVTGTTSSSTGSHVGPEIMTFAGDPSAGSTIVDHTLLRIGLGATTAASSHDMLGDGTMLVGYPYRGALCLAVVKVVDNEVRTLGTLSLGIAYTSNLYIYAFSPSLASVCWYDGTNFRRCLVRVDNTGVPRLTGVVESGTLAQMQHAIAIPEDAATILAVHAASSGAEASLSFRPRVVAMDGSVTERAAIAYATAASCVVSSLDIVRMTPTDHLIVYRETSTTGANLRLELLRLS